MSKQTGPDLTNKKVYNLCSSLFTGEVNRINFSLGEEGNFQSSLFWGMTLTYKGMM